VDSAWEQEKARSQKKALKMPQNPTRRVHALLGSPAPTRMLTKNQNHRQPDQILQRTLLLTNNQKTQTYKYAGASKTEHKRTRTPILQNLTLTENRQRQ